MSVFEIIAGDSRLCVVPWRRNVRRHCRSASRAPTSILFDGTLFPDDEC